MLEIIETDGFWCKRPNGIVVKKERQNQVLPEICLIIRLGGVFVYEVVYLNR